MAADLDFEKISRELGITPDFYRELLHDFMEQVAGDLKRLEELHGIDALPLGCEWKTVPNIRLNG